MKRKALLLFLVLITVLTVVPLSGCSKDVGNEFSIRSMDEIHNCKIGLQTGVSFDGDVKVRFPDCAVNYFQTNYDLMFALDNGKIDVIACDEPFAYNMVRERESYSILGKVSEDWYRFTYPKDAEKTPMLCGQMNDFIEELKSDGTLYEMQELWLSTDEEKKTVDLSGLTGENGILKMGVSVDGAAPFTYMKDGKIVGYEIDIAERFCRKYGYGLEITDYNFTGLMTAISTGKVDMGASCISMTEERKETLVFSDSEYDGGVVVIIKLPTPVYSSTNELSDKRIGVITGSVFDQIARDQIPNVKITYLNTIAELAVALNSDKIDAYVCDEPVAKLLTVQNPNHSIIDSLADDHYGVIFRKNDEKGELLCSQMNEFIAKCRADGTLQKNIYTWIGKDASGASVDYESLPAPNGTLTYAISTSIGAPYAYVQNEKYAGYEIALAVAFCREYGYGIEFFDTSFTGMLSAVALGKCDFGSSGISITDERKESMLFSESIYDGGISVVVKNNMGESTKESFFEKIAESFDKTFIRENRWKMFVSGIGTTLLVTAIAAILGSLIGFVCFLLYRKKIKPIVVIFDAVSGFLEKMPTVIVLMILYYVIFGNSDISGIVVSAIGFTFMFSFSVLGLLQSGTDAVSFGQTEAALALGYTDRKAFLKMIFPQTVRYFMPGYKSALISLIKDTSIVGYIAVQDLTKVSDIVQSRTYEPFFPLIATAVIYLLLALILIRIVRSVEIGVDPKRRNPEKILKGVRTK
ncbi:MAG: transporter substrate-binding domain-containing protein [Clostridiales bacterium]|nr:transporter substrate-binding domain-containing protein [Clostridiales bacterium]